MLDTMPTRRNLILSSALALLALALAAPARASVVLPMDLDALSQKADVIVRGKTRTADSAWTGDGKRIQTTTRIDVANAIKGQAPATIEVRTPGGSVGDISQKVSGAPEFAPGEEVIVFLQKAPNSTQFQVVGMGQGKFNVDLDARGTPVVVQPQLTGLGVLGQDGKVRPAPRFEPMSEADFVGRVQRALGKGAP